MNHTLPAHETCHHQHYALTCQDYEQLLEDTGQCCEVCGLPAKDNAGKKLYIDHDYAYGNWAVRGLLCVTCNTLIAPRPGWNLPAHLDAEPYLANPWFRRRLAELRIPIEGPTEPLEQGQIQDSRARTWTRKGELWVCANWRVKPRTWHQLIKDFGPHTITVITGGFLRAPVDEPQVIAQLLLTHMLPEHLDALAWILAGGGSEVDVDG